MIAEARKKAKPTNHVRRPQPRFSSLADTLSRIPVRTMIQDDPAAAIAALRGGVAPHAALRRRLLAAMVPRDVCESWLKELPSDAGAHDGTGRCRQDVTLLRTIIPNDVVTYLPSATLR